MIMMLRLFLSKLNNNNNRVHRDNSNNINIFYHNQLHKYYKQNECTLRNIIKKCITPVEQTKNMKLMIYYKKLKHLTLLSERASHQQNQNYIRPTLFTNVDAS